MVEKIMIPVAAFAVTATGASAFSGDLLEKLDLDLTNEQVNALEEVHELRAEGADREEVREVLEDAGLDREDMQEIREAVRAYKAEQRAVIHEALEDGDYDAFIDAIEGTRLADVIDTEGEFETFVEAHELRENGDREGARELMEELGIEKPEGKRGHGRGGFDGDRNGFGPRSDSN